jgi:hypothetical protein
MIAETESGVLTRIFSKIEISYPLKLLKYLIIFIHCVSDQVIRQC